MTRPAPPPRPSLAYEARIRRAWLISIMVALAVMAPLLILLVAPEPRAGRGVSRELAAALGFAGISLMGLQFIPTSRIRIFADVFALDTLYRFHHRAAVAGFGMAMLHPLILVLANPYVLTLFDLRRAPAFAQAGVWGLGLFIVLVVTSVWRLTVRLSYDAWRALHQIVAIMAAGLVLVHMFLVDHHMASPLQRGYWLAMATVWTMAVAHHRVWRPLQLLRRPYRVVGVRPERDRVWTLTVEPDGHTGHAFLAGQFAWLSARTSPFSFRDNPFSYSSSAVAAPRLEFTVKEVGDFTRLVAQLKPGEVIYVDGPYGTFNLHATSAPGLVMIAGGIGAAPVLSILTTMADKSDDRPVLFIYGNNAEDRITFREELSRLEARMNLHVVHVLAQPTPEWQGERGYVTRELLERVLPTEYSSRHFFVCGPVAMIESVEAALAALQVPLAHVHTEHFDMA